MRPCRPFETQNIADVESLSRTLKRAVMNAALLGGAAAVHTVGDVLHFRRPAPVVSDHESCQA